MGDQVNSLKPKRRLKNPESFREKIAKASEEKSKPMKVRSKVTWPVNLLKKIFRPVGNGYQKLKSIKQLKPLFIVLAFIGRIIFPKYLRNSFREIKKVTWPSFEQGRKLTWAVLVFALVFGASVAIVDWGLGKVFKRLLLK